MRGLFETTPGVVDVARLAGGGARARARERRPREGGPQGHPGRGRGGDARRAGRRARRRPDRRPGLARAGAGARPPLRRRPREPRAPARRSVSTRPRGGQVAIGELARVERLSEPQPLVRKDLKPVVYVMGDLAGEKESPVYAILELEREARRPHAPRRDTASSATRPWLPRPRTAWRMKWDGEWQITYEVFRDLGIAFAVVLVLIAILVIGWFQSFSVPLAILLPIPLSLIGILPGHFLFGRLLHRHLDDRLHRGGRDHRAQLDHPRGLHRAEAAPGDGARGGGGRGGRRALPSHAAHRGRGRGGLVRDAVRPDLPGPRASA